MYFVSANKNSKQLYLMLLDAEHKSSGPLNKRSSRFTFVKITISSSAKVKESTLPGGDEFSCFISTNKLKDSVTFRNYYSLSKLEFRCSRIILSVQTKEVISDMCANPRPRCLSRKRKRTLSYDYLVQFLYPFSCFLVLLTRWMLMRYLVLLVELEIWTLW